MDLGRLTVVRQLGSGGQGKVLLATDPEGEAFAVKVLALRPGADRELILRRAATLRCDPAESALPSILSFGRISEAPVELRRQLGQVPKDAIFLVMRFVRGNTVSAAVAKRPFSLREAAAAVAGLARALGRLPEGVAHGDVRAPNVFIRPSGEIALVDPDLMREPGEADDRHAVALLGRDLLAAGAAITGETPASEMSARTKLAALLADLDGPAPVGAEEAAQRSAEIAISLGASAGDVTAVLANRVAEEEVLPSGRPAGRSSAAPRIPLALGAVAVAVAVAGAAILVASAIWFSGRQRKLETVAGDEIYDTTGTVHYDEPIHQLGPSEHVAAGDGMVNFKFEASIPRVALLTPREDLLWEMRTPPAGASVYLDVKPGRYFVEQDRDLDGTIQPDRQLLEIDRHHPLRVTTTKAIVNSPHRPGATPEDPPAGSAP